MTSTFYGKVTLSIFDGVQNSLDILCRIRFNTASWRDILLRVPVTKSAGFAQVDLVE
jgi:hypothetical protein